MQYSAIPSKFQIPFAKNAGASYINAIPQASQIGIVAGRASLNDGFPPVTFLPTGSGGTPPFGADFNGILNQITAWVQWTNAGGLVEYDGTFSAAIGGYPAGAMLAAVTPGSVWLCTVDNNTSNPDTGGSGWVQLTGTISLSAIAANVQNGTWIYVVDSGTADALVVAPTPPVTSYVAGLGLIVKKAGSPNATTTPVVTVSGLGNKTILRSDASSIQPNDLPAFGLFQLEYDGTNFRLMSLAPSTVRIRLTANRTFYLSPSGSDSTGNGTAGSPWATLQFAFNTVYEDYDLAGFSITFQLANGTYTAGILWDGLFLGQTGPIFITGNPGSPTSVIINVVGAPCFHFRYGANVFCNGFRLLCGVTSLYIGACMAEYGGYIGFDNHYFDNCGNCNHIYSNFGTVTCSGHYWITGGAVAHHFCSAGGYINVQGATVVVTGTPTFTTFCSLNGGNVYAIGASFTGSAHGARYFGGYGGLINTGGAGVNFFPGDSAGSSPTGYYI